MKRKEPKVTITISTRPAAPGQLEAWRKFWREMMVTKNETKKAGSASPGH